MAPINLTEDFNDGELNAEPWVYSYDVTEVDGHLRISQSTTDLTSQARIEFDTGLTEATISYDAYMHAANNYFYGRNGLSFTSATGEQLSIRFHTQRTNYGPSYDNDPANFDLPKLWLVPSDGDNDSVYSTGENTSSYFDAWTRITVEFDSDAGTVTVDMESDGVVDIELFDEDLVGATLDSYGFASYGWWTGHYTLIDNLQVTGETSLDRETPVSNGFDMPVGERDGLLVTESRASEDGWQDGWYNASDLGDPHPWVIGANHLGEDWNLDDLDGDGADEDDTGQSVYAVSIGRVVYAGEYFGASGPSAGLGETVVIEHLLPDGRIVYSLYAHLQENSITVDVGQIIEEQGYQIGAIGQTGAAQDGPHLHFEIFTIEGASGQYESSPWLLAMEEFAYTNDNITSGVESFTINYPQGSVTWFDPSDFIRDRIVFEVDESIEVSNANGRGTIAGGSGNDNLNGGNGNDTISGNEGADIMSGGNGGDLILGGDGSDYLVGGNGNDNLSGGADADQIDGGNGADSIEGGGGNDILLGGRGGDEFIFDLRNIPTGDDVILDFSTTDTITIVGGPDSFEELGFEQRQDGVAVYLDEDSSILLAEFSASEVTADVFNFL